MCVCVCLLHLRPEAPRHICRAVGFHLDLRVGEGVLAAVVEVSNPEVWVSKETDTERVCECDVCVMFVVCVCVFDKRESVCDREYVCVCARVFVNECVCVTHPASFIVIGL